MFVRSRRRCTRCYKGLIFQIRHKFLQLLSIYIERIVKDIEPLMVDGRDLKCEELV